MVDAANNVILVKNGIGWAYNIQETLEHHYRMLKEIPLLDDITTIAELKEGGWETTAHIPQMHVRVEAIYGPKMVGSTGTVYKIMEYVVRDSPDDMLTMTVFATDWEVSKAAALGYYYLYFSPASESDW